MASNLIKQRDKQKYCIAGKFGGHKVCQIQSSKDLVKKGLVNE